MQVHNLLHIVVNRAKSTYLNILSKNIASLMLLRNAALSFNRKYSFVCHCLWVKHGLYKQTNIDLWQDKLVTMFTVCWAGRNSGTLPQVSIFTGTFEAQKAKKVNPDTPKKYGNSRYAYNNELEKFPRGPSIVNWRFDITTVNVILFLLLLFYDGSITIRLG